MWRSNEPAHLGTRSFTRNLRTVWLAWAVGMACAPAYGYDIARLLGVPYPTDLVSAARAQKIAWIANDRGIRNVWTAAAPSFAPQVLTHRTQDDGQELSSLRSSRDGSRCACSVWVTGRASGRCRLHAKP